MQFAILGLKDSFNINAPFAFKKFFLEKVLKAE